AKQLRESLEGRVFVEHISENTQGHLAPDSLYAPMKRYIEFCTAIIALVALSPLLLLFALLIRLDSKGPALFKQTRMGYRGRPFTVFKFRSMRVQDENARNTNTDMTQSDDDRITRIGRFIRKTRIDELPQIWNILRGEMSWIGPRPETLNLSRWYEGEIPFYRYRHVVRPGITGWAQVNQGHVTSVDDVREKLEYDFYYVRHFSIWLDILIVIQTIRVVLTGHGAK
ncbi:MAG: exopolysaccharide biosynthesis polyprenyl glycosylphosphotransferase, partial [Pseudomonadota bacterium]